jgi:hypothetical protein
LKPPSHLRYVLIICYDFPDIRSAGIVRTYQFAKGLPSFGWEPVILTAQPCSTAQEHNIETSDGHLKCPKITATAVKVLPTIDNNRHRLGEPMEGRLANSNGVIKSVVRFASDLAVPDGKFGWLPTAVRRSLQVARDYPISVCFSVSPRPTAHLVARRVKKCLGIPWVADFALPWSDAYWLSGRPRFIGRIDQQLEGSVVRSAQRVTVAYPDIARSICARFGANCQKKISVVPTGYSDDLFTQENVQAPAKFSIVYPGNHFCEEGRYGEYFLKAIDEWISLNPQLKEQLEFLFMGKRDDELLRQRAAMAHPEVVRVERFISHRACIQEILSSHMCVVNTVGNRIPAKTYECMRAGKWILALADPGSDLDHLMRQYRTGISIPARDIAAIRSVLQSAFQRSRSELCAPIKTDLSIEAYSSAHGAEKLAAIFEKLVTAC